MGYSSDGVRGRAVRPVTLGGGMNIGTRTPDSEFDFTPEQAPPLARVREWVRDRLRALHPDLVGDTELVVTELTTNAIEHTSGLLAVRLELLPGDQGLRVEIDDASPHTSPLVGRSTLGTWRGRGLVMVEHVCASWGVRRHSDHKTVWARLPVAA
ncbi:ATP-binding protein [Catellatospora bangladeshensis]